MSELVGKSVRFATRAHGRIDQRRRYSWQPYDVHLKAVAEIVGSVSEDTEMIAAAWLHDTVEDTPATLDEIRREFGASVAELVEELTDVSGPADGNRAERKALDCRNLAAASSRAQTVKLADLIDNCRDICKNDPEFGLVFLAEMEALLGVLTQGDPGLQKRAGREHQRWTTALASEESRPDRARGSDADAVGGWSVERPVARTLRQFARVFAAQDIAEPLRSFDAGTPLSVAARTIDAEGVPVAGVRQAGRIGGFVPTELAGLDASGTCGDARRSFVPAQVLDAPASLADVIRVLTRHDHCFVRSLGDVNGVITRADIQKPLVRMWLFGIITFVEMHVTEQIRMLWTEDEWASRLAAGRLAKAREMHDERRRRGQACDLIDCLQFSDRVQVLMENPEQRARFGFGSRASAKRVIKEIESLRNNLAHAQDIVTHDWAQIARLARRIEEISGFRT